MLLFELLLSVLVQLHSYLGLVYQPELWELNFHSVPISLSHESQTFVLRQWLMFCGRVLPVPHPTGGIL